MALIPDNNIYLAVSCAPEAEPTFVLFCLILNILNLVFINSMHVLYYDYILLYMQIPLVFFYVFSLYKLYTRHIILYLSFYIMFLKSCMLICIALVYLTAFFHIMTASIF